MIAGPATGMEYYPSRTVTVVTAHLAARARGGLAALLTGGLLVVSHPALSMDGLYVTNRSFPPRFWKVALSGGAPTLVFAGGDPFAIDSFSEALMDGSHAFRFSAARSLERLALTHRLYDTNILRLEPGTPESTPPKPLIGSSQVDESPQLSPDGRRIAFTSMRSGYQGRGRRRLPCAESSLASSPDGRFRLYVGVVEGSDIARVDGFRFGPTPLRSPATPGSRSA